MNSSNKQEAVSELQMRLIRLQAWQCCLNCLNWTGTECDKFKAVPPPHIIATGCRDYENDIPF